MSLKNTHNTLDFDCSLFSQTQDSVTSPDFQIRQWFSANPWDLSTIYYNYYNYYNRENGYEEEFIQSHHQLFDNTIQPLESYPQDCYQSIDKSFGTISDCSLLKNVVEHVPEKYIVRGLHMDLELNKNHEDYPYISDPQKAFDKLDEFEGQEQANVMSISQKLDAINAMNKLILNLGSTAENDSTKKYDMKNVSVYPLGFERLCYGNNSRMEAKSIDTSKARLFSAVQGTPSFEDDCDLNETELSFCERKCNDDSSCASVRSYSSCGFYKSKQPVRLVRELQCICSSPEKIDEITSGSLNMNNIQPQFHTTSQDLVNNQHHDGKEFDSEGQKEDINFAVDSKSDNMLEISRDPKLMTQKIWDETFDKLCATINEWRSASATKVGKRTKGVNNYQCPVDACRKILTGQGFVGHLRRHFRDQLFEKIPNTTLLRPIMNRPLHIFKRLKTTKERAKANQVVKTKATRDNVSRSSTGADSGSKYFKRRSGVSPRLQFQCSKCGKTLSTKEGYHYHTMKTCNKANLQPQFHSKQRVFKCSTKKPLNLSLIPII